MFWVAFCIVHLLVAFVSGRLVDDGVCLCVLFRIRLRVFLSPPCLRWLTVHVHPCDGLGLAYVPMVLGLLGL
jgi:hypothetical protein